jgi:hypothetical protein
MTTQSILLPHSQTASDAGHETRAEARSKASTGAPPHAAGMLWFGGWLFTIGFAKLVWWKALLGLVVWPYFLGDILR